MKKIMIIALILLFAVYPKIALCSDRFALVIGNSDYQDVPLQSPVNDANDIAATLQTVGFTVIKKTDVTQQEMEEGIRTFARKLKPDDVGLVYFSGHGLQVDGINYLIPVGTRISSEDEIKYKAIEAGMILDKMQKAKSRVNGSRYSDPRMNPQTTASSVALTENRLNRGSRRCALPPKAKAVKPGRLPFWSASGNRNGIPP